MVFEYTGPGPSEQHRWISGAGSCCRSAELDGDESCFPVAQPAKSFFVWWLTPNSSLHLSGFGSPATVDTAFLAMPVIFLRVVAGATASTKPNCVRQCGRLREIVHAIMAVAFDGLTFANCFSEMWQPSNMA